MPAPTFLPFDLLFQGEPGRYEVRVLDSPVGQARAPLALDLTRAERAAFLARLGRGQAGAVGDTSDNAAAQEFGRRLFDALFSRDIESLFRRSLDAARRSSAGLRLLLRLNDTPELADMPWEFLYDADRGSFLAVSTETAIVRYLELAEAVEPLAVKPPLKLLVVLSNPSDYPELDVEGEWRDLNNALADLNGQGRVTVERLDTSTPEAFQGELRRGGYHVLHLIGHGSFDAQRQEGAVVLTNANGRGVLLDAEHLGALLGNAPSLRLVLLNACEGGRTSTRNPFAGVAPRLVQQGLPAVMAMQFEITDTAADSFAHEFYRALADNYPVDAAVAEARRALYVQGSALEWGTPVLLMRARDGRLFETEEAEMEKSKAEQPSRRGGVNISGNAQVSVGRDLIGGDKVVNADSYDEGDTYISTIGAGAHVGQVAVGRNITQSSGAGGGEERNELAGRLLELSVALQKARGGLDASRAALADFQFQLLQSELSKTGTNETPSANTLTMVGDWLWENVPAVRPALTALFTSVAGRRLVAQAGASDWAAKRFR